MHTYKQTDDKSFTCGILSGLICSEFYEQQGFGKVCGLYWIGYVYRF